MKVIDNALSKYVEWEKITKEEFDKALLELPEKEFKKYYRSQANRSVLSSEKMTCEKAKYPSTEEMQYLMSIDTLDEIRKLQELQSENVSNTRTIKYIGMFFLAVSIISMIIAIASAASFSSVVDALRMF